VGATPAWPSRSPQEAGAAPWRPGVGQTCGLCVLERTRGVRRALVPSGGAARRTSTLATSTHSSASAPLTGAARWVTLHTQCADVASITAAPGLIYTHTRRRPATSSRASDGHAMHAAVAAVTLHAAMTPHRDTSRAEAFPVKGSPALPTLCHRGKWPPSRENHARPVGAAARGAAASRSGCVVTVQGPLARC
jgi:hypothetical protein